METILIDDALWRIRVEYIEMPDLKLTRVQARRLWNLTQEACDVALAILVRTGFLGQTTDGKFMRRSFDDAIVHLRSSDPCELTKSASPPAAPAARRTSR